MFELVPVDYRSRGGTYSYPVVVLAAGETKGGKAVTQVRADDVHWTGLYCSVLYYTVLSPRSGQMMSTPSSSATRLPTTTLSGGLGEEA